MIDAAAIERAEKVLSVVYGGGLDRQLSAVEVEREAVDNVVAHCWNVIARNYGESYSETDPRLIAAINTMLVHMFLVGLICGRSAAREIV